MKEPMPRLDDRRALTLIDLTATSPEWAQALPVLRELRASLTDERMAQVFVAPPAQRLRFSAVFDGGRCVGVAGWRLVTCTSAGRKLYVDDLITSAAARSTGVGAFLLQALRTRAERAGCSALELDSGVQRHAAHRFYLRERMRIAAHHFSLALDPRPVTSERHVSRRRPRWSPNRSGLGITKLTV